VPRQAVVLVGGFGTRLRPLTLEVPKQMLPIGGTTMLERVVSRLAEFGVEEVVLSLGYRPDVFQAEYSDDRCGGIRLSYAIEPEPLDTAGAIAFAARHAGISDTFLAFNGDVLTDLDVGALVDVHRSTGADATIHLIPVEDPSRFGVVPTADDGRVLDFVEKPPAGTAPSNWINAGSYVLEPSVLDLIQPGVPTSIERKTFPQLVADRRLFAHQSDVYWIDAGTPEAYLQANLDEIDGRRTSAAEPVQPEAIVHADAKVARSVIGADARVMAGASVTDSVVMDGATIDEGAIVEQSIVGARSHVGSRSEIRSLSVIGFDRSVAPGTSLDGETQPPQEEWS
jgi:mannose-1-phosphate guanylyltransferase